MEEPHRNLFEEFINGGWIVPIMGGLAMFTRILVTDPSLHWLDQLKKIGIAIIATTLAWFLIEPTEISSFYKAMCYGLTGFISPEIIGGLVNFGEKFSKNPDKYINK